MARGSLSSRVRSFFGDDSGEFDPFAEFRNPAEETQAYAGDAGQAKADAEREVAKLGIARGASPNAPAVPSGGNKLTLILSLLSRLPH
jgi:hypothetical protein